MIYMYLYIFIYSGYLENLPELRQVTTMFLHLDSYSHVEHIDPISLQPFFYLLQSILDQTGTFLRYFLVYVSIYAYVAIWGVYFEIYMYRSYILATIFLSFI
jgi:hypothetical protein